MPFITENKPPVPSFGEEQPHEPGILDNAKSFIWETVKVVVISLLIIVPVRYYLIQPFYVQGASMEPSFYNKEYLVINEISYRFEDIERGDVVVFHYPRDPKQFFIKRVVGLPGEQVIVRDNSVTVVNSDHPEGFVLDESLYLGEASHTSGNLRVSLDIGEYYVLGDNRGASLDSRGFGPIERDVIVGRVWLRGWPLNRTKVFNEPVYITDDTSEIDNIQ